MLRGKAFALWRLSANKLVCFAALRAVGFIVTRANYHDSRSVPILLSKYRLRRPRYQQHMNLDSAYDTALARIAIKELLRRTQFTHHILRNRRNSRQVVERMSAEDKVHMRAVAKHTRENTE